MSETSLAMTRVYCFTGYPASGKSTAGEIASDEGYPVIEMGEAVRSRAYDALGKDATSEEIGEWATQHREVKSNDIFARYTAESVASESSEIVIIDGLRTLNELQVFRNRFETVVLVYVETPFETRLQRIQTRNREDEGDYTKENLQERDAREDEWGVKELLKNDHFDIKIRNTGSFEEFKSDIRDLLTGSRS